MKDKVVNYWYAVQNFFFLIVIKRNHEAFVFLKKLNEDFEMNSILSKTVFL